MTDESKPEEQGVSLQDEVDAFVEGATGLFDSLRDVFAKSREEILRGARLGKVRIDVYQLRKDRELLMQKLGELAYGLLDAGSLDHADLKEQFAEIHDLDEEIAKHDDEISSLAETVGDVAADMPAEEAAANEEPPAKKPTTKKAPKPTTKKASKPAAKKAAPRAKASSKRKPAAKKSSAKKSTGTSKAKKKSDG